MANNLTNFFLNRRMYRKSTTSNIFVYKYHTLLHNLETWEIQLKSQYVLYQGYSTGRGDPSVHTVVWKEM